MIESDNHKPDRPAPAWWMILAPLLIMTIIFGISSRSSLPDLDGGRGLQDIAGHFIVYAALGASLALLFRAIGWNHSRSLVFAVLIATLYGVSDEFHQSFVPNRSVEIKDVVVDCLGAIAGASFVLLLFGSRPINSRSDADPAPPVDENF